MRTTLGYLDAGSSSLILQAIAGGVGAVAVTAKLFWQKILRFLGVKRDRPDSSAESSPDA